LSEFVRLIRAHETSSELELARQVVMLVEAAERSLAHGGVPVSVGEGAGAPLTLGGGDRARARIAA